MTSQPWTRVKRGYSAAPNESLQWSHDLSAMDTMESMAGQSVMFDLQWSHDLSVMDTLCAAGDGVNRLEPSLEP